MTGDESSNDKVAPSRSLLQTSLQLLRGHHNGACHDTTGY